MLVRSYSRISGSSSLESVTGMVGVALADQVAQARLVRAVGVGVDEADGDRIDARRPARARRRARAAASSSARSIAPAVVDALVDLEAQPPRHQRRRLAPADVVEHRHAQAPDLQHVAKAVAS